MFPRIALSLTSLLVASAALAPMLVAAESKTGQLKAFAYKKGGAQTSDDKVFWLSPGQSFCGTKYRDESEVACVKGYWLDKKPDGMDSCQRYVKITNPTTGVEIFSQVLDKCGDVKNSTFGINDIYVSLKSFKKLSGLDYPANKEAGNLQTQVKWDFVVESCQACASGVFARDEEGKEDTCKGRDAFGLHRCGRKKGAERATTQEEVNKVCNYGYKCPKESEE